MPKSVTYYINSKNGGSPANLVKIMNAASSNLSDFADTVSSHGEDSPVNDAVVFILKHMASMTDAEITSAYLTTKITVWNSSKHGYDEALQLPEGTLRCGMFQQDVKPEYLKQAVDYLKANQNGSFWEAVTQAEIIRKANPDTF